MLGEFDKQDESTPNINENFNLEQQNIPELLQRFEINRLLWDCGRCQVDRREVLSKTVQSNQRRS